MPIRKAKVTFRKPTQLGRTLWEAPTVSATILVGANRGEQPRNNTGFCRKQPRKFTQKQLDETVIGIRTFQLDNHGLTPNQVRKNLAASRIEQRGWYKGAPEQSASFLFVHNPGIPGEETPAKFQAAMKRLGELVGGSLCQDEVIVVFQDPKGSRAAGVVDDARDRRVAQALPVRKTVRKRKR